MNTKSEIRRVGAHTRWSYIKCHTSKTTTTTTPPPDHWWWWQSNSSRFLRVSEVRNKRMKKRGHHNRHLILISVALSILYNPTRGERILCASARVPVKSAIVCSESASVYCASATFKCHLCNQPRLCEQKCKAHRTAIRTTRTVKSGAFVTWD